VEYPVQHADRVFNAPGPIPVQEALDLASGFVERWEEAALFPACQRESVRTAPKRAFRKLITGWAVGPIVDHAD
jgi:hypothetical protein